jgi:nicotinamidase/pyrazinamidase
MDAHTENDPEFRDWPPHCVAGTAGQQKPAATLLEKRTTIPNGLRDFHVKGAQQILLEKQSVDCFTNPNLPALLDRLDVKSCVVYGVVTEICVKNAAFGLLKSGRKVTLVTDAVRGLDDAKSAQFLEEFAGAGGELTNVSYFHSAPKSHTL